MAQSSSSSGRTNWRSKPKAALAKTDFFLQNPRFSVLRPDDLLALEFECINLRIQQGPPPKLIRIKASEQAYIVVHFPPQHIAEQAFFEKTPEFKADKNDPKNDDSLKNPPVLSLISGPTRLAFLCPQGGFRDPPDPGIASCVGKPGTEPGRGGCPAACSCFRHTGPRPHPDEGARSGFRRRCRPLHPARLCADYSPGRLDAPGRLQGPHFRRSRTSSTCRCFKIAPPAGNQTAIELPYRLILSPHALNLWAHSIPAVTRHGRTELWHTRLAAANPDGSIVDTGSPYMAIRAVWSPDCNVDAPSPGPGHSNDPFRMSLDRQDRHEIVHLTSNFRMKYAGSAWQPKPVEVDRLMLSSLGGWLDSSGTWKPTPLSVEEWDHNATLGRDHYVKVVYKGFLMPFGHAASLVKITERKFYKKGDNDDQIAYLFQRMYIIVRQPDKTFPAPFQMYEGREIPFRKVRITTRTTPPLEDPADSELYPKTLQSAFWPRVGNKDFRFHCIGTDWAGNNAEFTTPMAFVDANYAFDLANMGKVVEAYNKNPNTGRRRPSLNGRKVAFAAPKKPGDTDLEATHITFTAKLPETQAALDQWQAADQPRFFPVMDEAEVSIPALKAMVQFGGTDIRYPRTYIQNGLGGTNKGEVFASIPGAPGLNFGAGQGAKAGGVATPSFPIVGLSRALGPVGGILPPSATDPAAAAELALADVIGGRFDPKEIL